MVTMTLPSVVDRYPAGTVIEVYLASQRRDGMSPAGSVITTGTVQVSGSVTFSGLAPLTNYVGYAFVESQHRYVAFSTPEEVAPDGSADYPFFMGSSTLAGDGRKTVTTAATAERLVASSTPATWLYVQPLPSNTNVVAVGAATVAAGAGTTRGTALSPGDPPTAIPVSDLHEIYVDARTSGEGVCFTYG